jgi:hypothetical protein
VELRERRDAGLRRAPGRGPSAVIICAVFAVAAIAATEPAVAHLTTHFLAGGAPGHGEAAPGDHLQSDYRLWLAGHQLEHGRTPWTDPYSFQPEAGSTVNAAWWPFGLTYWPLDRLFGSVLAWNVFTLLCLFAAGVLAALWLLELELSLIAAAAGGLAFEIAPYRVMQSRGHLLGPTSLLLPLALWAFERARSSGRWGWWALSWAALASIPLSGQVHLALGAIPFFALYVVCRSTARRDLVAAGVGVVAAVLAGVLIRLTVIAGSIDAGGRSLREVRVYSATGLDFFTRHARHGVEAFVFLGWLTPLAAIAGLALLVVARELRLAVVLGIGAVVPVLLALGTHFPLYSPLWHAFPPLRYPRVPERMMPIACLCIAALLAVAVDWGLRRPEVQHAAPLALGAVVAVVLLADLHVRAFHASAADSSNAAYAAVKRAPTGRLVEVPVFTPDIHYGSTYLYYEQRVLRDRPLGYSTTAPRKADVVARHLQPLNCGDWTTGVADRLRILQVSAITLHRGLFTGNPLLPNTAALAWRGLVAHGWRPVATDGAVTTFVPGRSRARAPFPGPSRDEAVFCGGWFPADQVGHQMSSRHASLLVYGSGILRLFVQSPQPEHVRISVDGRFHSELTVAALRQKNIGLSSTRWHLVTFDSGPLLEIRGKPRGARVVAYALP